MRGTGSASTLPLINLTVLQLFPNIQIIIDFPSSCHRVFDSFGVVGRFLSDFSKQKANCIACRDVFWNRERRREGRAFLFLKYILRKWFQQVQWLCCKWEQRIQCLSSMLLLRIRLFRDESRSSLIAETFPSVIRVKIFVKLIADRISLSCFSYSFVLAVLFIFCRRLFRMLLEFSSTISSLISAVFPMASSMSRLYSLRDARFMCVLSVCLSASPSLYIM